jgi:murein endopeptidase
VAVRENLNAREFRSLKAPSAGRLPAKTALTVMRRADDSTGAHWVKLTFRKTTGWVPLARTKRAPEPACRSRATGRASSGRLTCGKLLPAWTSLWVTQNPTNGASPNAANRRWGTDEILATIETVTLAYWRRFPDAPRIVIGDISRRYGGRFPIHSSHQQGIDVDVWYPRRAGGRSRTPRGPGDIDRRRSQWLVERFAAERAEVVYVGTQTGLRRSRRNIKYLAYGHDTHFHVRLSR